MLEGYLIERLPYGPNWKLEDSRKRALLDRRDILVCWNFGRCGTSPSWNSWSCWCWHIIQNHETWPMYIHLWSSMWTLFVTGRHFADFQTDHSNCGESLTIVPKVQFPLSSVRKRSTFPCGWFEPKKRNTKSSGAAKPIHLEKHQGIGPVDAPFMSTTPWNFCALHGETFAGRFPKGELLSEMDRSLDKSEFVPIWLFLAYLSLGCSAFKRW